jgi:hypothetical protein
MREFADGMADAAEFAAEFTAVAAEFAAEFTAVAAEFAAVVRVFPNAFAVFATAFTAPVVRVFAVFPILVALNIELILCIIKITNRLQW